MRNKIEDFQNVLVTLFGPPTSNMFNYKIFRASIVLSIGNNMGIMFDMGTRIEQC